MVSQSETDDFIARQLDERIRKLEELLDADTIAYSGALIHGVDDDIRSVIEALASRRTKRDRLAVLLTTTGGDIETVARIVETFRQHYDYVEFVIPNYAFSAGTVLALSGDAIRMDYYSRLGPIDPQVQSTTGELVPALGYLARYEDLLKKANSGRASEAEVALLMSFDQAELYMFDQARELTITLLKEWLVRYKFRDWKTTEGRGADVTDDMRTERADEIARGLNDTSRWHSHGLGISMSVLWHEMKLQIDDFGADAELSHAIRATTT